MTDERKRLAQPTEPKSGVCWSCGKQMAMEWCNQCGVWQPPTEPEKQKPVGLRVRRYCRCSVWRCRKRGWLDQADVFQLRYL